MAEQDRDTELDPESQRLREENTIKDSMIQELSQALSDANLKVAMLNGQKTLRDQTIDQLRQQIAEHKPTV